MVGAGQDISPAGANVPSRRHEGSSSKRTPMTALHVAALNTLQDHAAGVTVSPIKLEAACRLLGRPLPNAAATNPVPARVFTPEEA
jgi:hypothetical protein